MARRERGKMKMTRKRRLMTTMRRKLMTNNDLHINILCFQNFNFFKIKSSIKIINKYTHTHNNNNR